MDYRTSKELPPDAVVLGEIEATAYVWDIVDNWNSWSETWALRSSANILGGVSAACGLILNRHYRVKLRLGYYGHFSSFIPLVLLPGAFSTLFHKQAVTTDILLMKSQACPICIELKSAAIQCTVGMAYPLILAPVTSFMLANRYCTARIPSLVDNKKELFMFWLKISKPLKSTLVYMLVSHLLFSTVLTYFQFNNAFNIRKNIKEIEEKISSEFDGEN